MSAHTPGPWVVQGFRVYGPTDPRSKHGNGRVLVGGVVDDGIDWRCTQFENPDDIRLFENVCPECNADISEDPCACEGADRE